MTFRDRRDAGARLASALGNLEGEDAVILALPRGGIPVAAEIALSLRAPMDVLLVRKIGVPSQPELAMGAVVEGREPIVVRNEHIIRLSWVSAREFEQASREEIAEIDRRRKRYQSGPPLDVEGRTVILVDDGIATGATMRAAVRGLKQRKPKRIVVAVPVAPPDVVAEFGEEADAVVCLEQPHDFRAIGFHYRDFHQIGDDEVMEILAAVREAHAERGGQGARRNPAPGG